MVRVRSAVSALMVRVAAPETISVRMVSSAAPGYASRRSSRRCRRSTRVSPMSRRQLFVQLSSSGLALGEAGGDLLGEVDLAIVLRLVADLRAGVVDAPEAMG